MSKPLPAKEDIELIGRIPVTRRSEGQGLPPTNARGGELVYPLVCRRTKVTNTVRRW